MVYKVDGNPQLDRCDWSMYSNILKSSTKSNHPPKIIKQIPASISRRISDLSCNKEVFERAKPYYDERLKSSGYREDTPKPKIDQTRGKTEKEKLFGLTHHLVKTFKQM